MAARGNRIIIRLFTTAHRLVYTGTGGRICGRIGDADVLLLSTTGRTSGRVRTTPLMFMRDGDDLIVVASNGGSDKAPGWWLNLSTNLRGTVQVKKLKWNVAAREATGDDRAELWTRLLAVHPDYHTYTTQTKRQIPVVRLRRAR